MFVARAAAQGFQPSGMTKNGTQTWPLSSASWVAVTAWTPDVAGKPGSSVVNDQLVVQSGGTSRTVTANVAYTSGNGTHTIRLVDQNGIVIATGVGVATAAGTCIVTATADLTAITSIGVQMSSNATITPGTVTSGSTTFLTIT